MHDVHRLYLPLSASNRVPASTFVADNGFALSNCIYPGQETGEAGVLRRLCHKGRGYEQGVPDQAVDQGEEAGVDEILNVDKHFDTLSDFKGVEHYAA